MWGIVWNYADCTCFVHIDILPTGYVTYCIMLIAMQMIDRKRGGGKESSAPNRTRTQYLTIATLLH